MTPVAVTKTVTIVYNSNSTTNKLFTDTTSYGSTYKLLSAETLNFTNNGKVFLGWALSEDGDVAYFNEDVIDIDFNSITLYAIWRDKDNSNMLYYILLGVFGAMAVAFGSLAIFTKRKKV